MTEPCYKKIIFTEDEFKRTANTKVHSNRSLASPECRAKVT